MSSFSLENIQDFLIPINRFELSNDEGFRDNQLGNHIDAYEDYLPALEEADIILLGCGESRGAFSAKIDDETPNSIRRQFYGLYHWHSSIKVADLGNVKSGATLQDTYAALQLILKELMSLGKLVVLLGGSHDLTTAQYHAYQVAERLVDIVCVDAKINLDVESPVPTDNFLLPLFTEDPNFIRTYNHIAFQSYLVHPVMLETIDKLHFDCYRVGKVRDAIQEMEPVIRSADMLSFDVSAIQNAFAPSHRVSPNGLTGEDACILMQYAGMATNISTIGIYGHCQENDTNEMTAIQISQMLWYLMDGLSNAKKEASIQQTDAFNIFNIRFSEIDSKFIQSRKTGRWWMEIPGNEFVPCSYKDYYTATQDEIPERYFRAVERS